MKRYRTIILLVLCGIVAITAGAGLGFYRAWNATGDDIFSPLMADSEKKETTNYSELLKQQGKFNILLMGEDNVEGSRRSDTILFITVDLDDKNMRVMSLPRDTRVEIPRHGVQKLNHAFAFGGPELMKATIEKYLGQPILYYVLVDYDSFPEFVDMLGGVEVDVQKRMRYVDRAGHLDINIQPGKQVLDGKQALHFVRFRKDALGDIGRIQRQQQFIKALIKKAYDPRIIVKFPELAAQAMKIFRTDMAPKLAVQLAGYTQHELGRDRMFFSTLHGEPAMINRLSYWIGDVESANAFLNAPYEELVSGDLREGKGKKGREVHFSNAMNELDKPESKDEKAKEAVSDDAGATTAGGGAKKSGAAAAADAMTKDQLLATISIRSMPEAVAVLNGTGKGGVSSLIATRLQQLGVDVVYSGNAKHFDYEHNNIVYPTNASASVRETAKILGSLLGIPKNLVRPSKQAFYASIIAGHDYNRVVTQLDKLLKISGPGKQ